MINKVIILSRKINKISEGAENLYYRIYVNTDDYGHYHADPEILKGQIYTLKKISLDIIKARILELAKIELIKLYNSNGEEYLEIVNFEEHQKFRKDVARQRLYPIPGTFTKRDVTDSERGVTKRCLKLSKDKLSKDKISPDGSGTKKSSFGEFVTLTEDEHQKLIDKFGEKKTEKMIDILDNAKGSKGYKYKSDYRAILSWVVDKVNKENNETQGTRMACKQCGDNGQYAGIDESGVCANCRMKRP